MASIIQKRQGTFKVVFKTTKKKGVQIIISRYTSEAISEEGQIKYSKSEAFVTPNKKIIYADEVSKVIEKGIVSLLEEKEVTEVDIQRVLLIWS